MSTIPNPTVLHPLPEHERVVLLKPLVTDPRIEVGEFTYHDLPPDTVVGGNPAGPLTRRTGHRARPHDYVRHPDGDRGRRGRAAGAAGGQGPAGVMDELDGLISRLEWHFAYEEATLVAPLDALGFAPARRGAPPAG